MFTIVIAKDEKGIKDILAKLLKDEGYAVSEGTGNSISIGDAKKPEKASSLKDKIVELEDSLYNQKRGMLYKAVLDEIERPLIEHVLERTEGNQLKAAKILGINRNTMRTKTKRLGIDVNKWKV